MAVRFVAGEAQERPDARRFVLAGLIATVIDVGIAIGLLEVGLSRLAADVVALVAAAIATPLTGWVSDRLTVKRLLTLSIVGFTVASALCGLSETVAQIVASPLPT